MADTVLAEALCKQFGDAFDNLAAAIPTFSDEEWRTGRSPYDGPARAVVHALQCAEFYTQRDRAVFTNQGKPVWQMTGEELPAADAMAAYLEQTRGMTMAWIEDVSKAGFDQPLGEDGASGLECVVYALRHLQHHTGEVCCWQKQFNHPQENWT